LVAPFVLAEDETIFRVVAEKNVVVTMIKTAPLFTERLFPDYFFESETVSTLLFRTR